MTKRPERKARRKARRAKVKTEIDRWRETVYAQLLDLDKRLSTLEETVALMVKAKDSELPTARDVRGILRN